VLLEGWYLRGLLGGSHSLPAMLHQLAHAHALLVQHSRTRQVRQVWLRRLGFGHRQEARCMGPERQPTTAHDDTNLIACMLVAPGRAGGPCEKLVLAGIRVRHPLFDG
jgi:hypothetical protein